ncbi:hypothetical protein C7M84_018485 [Penaeus vannamei]|uniref:Uncharacterized protein n=1 Tax=Penaeus vannamei TaxID=6689 RepID=A0A423SHJ1_PENVA|nr:hypothetical protein C7M84_018485 [Penaeus vannamei]
MKAGKSTELDRVLVEWYRKCRNEGLKLTGNMIMEKAKIFHKELKIEGERDYGKGWLQRFKKRHGMLTAKMCGAKKASNHSGADKDGELEVGADEGEEIAEISSPSSRRTQALEDEILDMVLKDVENRKQDDSDCEDITELLSVEKLIKLTDELIDGLDHCDFMPKQEIIIFHLLLDKLHRERAKQLKQLGLDKTPKKRIHQVKDSENRMSKKKKIYEDESSVALPGKQECAEESTKSVHKTTQATSTISPIHPFPHDDQIAVTVSSPRRRNDKMPDRKSCHVQHNEHHTLILKRILEDTTFADVTLTAEGQSLKAHKAVLSAMSPYFKKVLQKNPSPHPIIIMPLDMSFEDLQGIINYIYIGEIIVPAENSSSLLKAAKILQISGLFTLDERVRDASLSFSDAQSAHPDNGGAAVSTNQSSGIWSWSPSGKEDVKKSQSPSETRMNAVSSSADIENLPEANWQEHTHDDSICSVPAVEEVADPLDIVNQKTHEDIAQSGESSHSLMADVLVLLPDQDALSRTADCEYSTRKEAWDDFDVRYLEGDCSFHQSPTISEGQWCETQKCVEVKEEFIE